MLHDHHHAPTADGAAATQSPFTPVATTDAPRKTRGHADAVEANAAPAAPPPRRARRTYASVGCQAGEALTAARDPVDEAAEQAALVGTSCVARARASPRSAANPHGRRGRRALAACRHKVPVGQLAAAEEKGADSRGACHPPRRPHDESPLRPPPSWRACGSRGARRRR